MLAGLFRYRFLSSDQLVRLGGGSRQKLLRRLRLMFDHGYVDRPRAQIASIVFGNAPMIYGLGHKGAKLLKQSGQEGTRWREKNQACTNYFIRHAVEQAEFFICLEQAAKAQSIRLHHKNSIINTPLNHLNDASWRVRFKWPSGDRMGINVTPDGLFGIEKENGEIAYFFVEIDRGTEPIVRRTSKQSSILKKFLAYKATHEDDATGLPNFRVLFVTTSQRRIDAMIDAIPQDMPKGLFLFSTLEATRTDIFGAAWRKAGSKTASLIG